MSSILIVLLSIASFMATGYAEEVENYGDCDICPGTIHYGAVEARKVIGLEGLKLIRKMTGSDHVIIKIDTDGVLKNGSSEDPETAYEIKIDYYQHTVYIKSLLDESYIQIVSDFQNAKRSSSLHDWHPEIYLQSSQSDKIILEDTVTDAWEKMKKSHIYYWIFSHQNHRSHLVLLGNKILYAFKLIAENKP
jgi:hypothetical protein